MSSLTDLNEQGQNVHEGHRERLRERYRENGVDGFSDHELLELLLGYTISRRDTNGLGHDLIREFGNLRGVFEAPEQDLEAVRGMGDKSAFLLKLISGLCRRYYQELHNGDLRPLEKKDPSSFFIPYFIGAHTEALYAAFLDENKSLIQCSLQYTGSINAVEIHAGKIVKQALRTGCRFVILAHNHFTDTLPSAQDMDATALVYRELQKYDVKLLDHVVVCGNKGMSMQISGHFSKSLNR